MQRPNESGPRKRADKRGRIGPVDQMRWRIPRAKSFVSVPAEAVTPLSKPAWLEAACTRLLLSICCTLRPVFGAAVFWPIGCSEVADSVSHRPHREAELLRVLSAIGLLD